MKFSIHIILLTCLVGGWTFSLAYDRPVFPFAPAAGQEGTTAVGSGDERIISWASSVVSIEYGEEVADEWKIPENALGPAGTAQSHLLVLGRGGSVTLEFPVLIADGPGFDFVVFENAFRETFLELAFVEVSSDGEHFARFPTYSLTANPVPAFGEVFPTFVHGFAGKYRTGFATPFDLQVLRPAFEAAAAGTGGFSNAYADHLIRNFPEVDLSRIRYVRILDIPGDGSAEDCEGFPIFDPYPTAITAGFDLDAVGVMNAGEVTKVSFLDWCKGYRVPDDWNDDFDKDGWTNSLEYVLGSDPSLKGSRPTLQQAYLKSTREYVFAFNLNPAALVQPVIEVSNDGESWREAEVLPVGKLVPASELGGPFSWEMRQPVGPGQALLVRLTAAE